MKSALIYVKYIYQCVKDGIDVMKSMSIFLYVVVDVDVLKESGVSRIEDSRGILPRAFFIFI